MKINPSQYYVVISRGRNNPRQGSGFGTIGKRRGRPEKQKKSLPFILLFSRLFQAIVELVERFAPTLLHIVKVRVADLVDA